MNFEGKVDKRAFQYGEMTEVRFIGGAPVVGESVFSSCEDLVAVSFEDCSIQIDEHSFLSAGKDMEVSFLRCSGLLDDRAFQYADLAKLSVAESELKMGESVFSSCERLVKYGFFGQQHRGRRAYFHGKWGRGSRSDDGLLRKAGRSGIPVRLTVQFVGKGQYSWRQGKVHFSSCEDLATVVLDGDSTILGENAFLGCEDLVDVKIREGRDESTVEIDDRAFQYCEKLESAVIGGDEVRIGEYAFGGCAENLSVTIQGKEYRAENLEKGYE
ncbi:MAG: leucine-rich repeat protein [Enterocloster sp.]